MKKGQLLVTFDQEFIAGKGYCLETPVLITNTDSFLDVVETSKGRVDAGEHLISVLK